MAREIIVEYIGRDRSLSSTNSSAIRSTSQLGEKLKHIGKVAALGFAAAGAVMGKFSVDAIGRASELNETLSKSAAIFGRQAPAIEKWASSAARSAGLSKNAALAAAAGFGDMFTQIGFAGKQAAAMSKDVVQMSADLGSFNNLPTADVADRISAALRGEYDSLQQVIPNINAARVESEALATTGKRTADQLTAQEKAAAVLAIVHEDGARAMGDFERTSGSLANQQKILGAQFENVQASLGQKLLPVATRLATWANDEALPALSRLGAYLGEKLPPIFEKVRSVVSTVMGAFSGDLGSSSSKLRQIAETVRQVFGQVVAAVRPTFDDIVSIIRDGIDIAKNLWALFGDNVLEYVRGAFDAVITVIRGAFTVVRGIFKTVSSLLKGDWAGVWDGIKTILRGAVQVVWGIIKGLWNMIRFSVKNIGVALINVTGRVLDGIRSLAKNGVAWVVGFLKSLPGRFRAGLGLLIGLSKSIWGKVWDVARDLVRSGVAWVVGQLRALPGKVRAGITALIEITRSIWGRVWDAARTLVTNGIGWVLDAVRSLPGKIRDLGSGLLDAGKAFIGKLWDGILAGARSVGGFVSDLMDSIRSGINNALNLPLTISFHKGPIDIDATLIPAFAKGTLSAPSGWAMVGENGPELVRMRGGEHIHTAAQTRRLLTSVDNSRGAAQGGAVVNHNSVTVNVYGVIDDAMVRKIEVAATQASARLGRPVLGTSRRQVVVR